MRFVLFYHSIVSDWNHGNAHFLRGFATELQRRGHEVRVYEPREGWSLQNLLRDQGPAAVAEFEGRFPTLNTSFYLIDQLDLHEVLDGADVVLVHEWNDHELVRRVGSHRANHNFCLLFHDTHHRGVTDPDSLSQYDLNHFDGVLAFGEVLREIYISRGWARRVWTWHEAADTTVFHPIQSDIVGDLSWIGNWGDGERTRELADYFMSPVQRLGLRATAFGVRYPQDAKLQLSAAGIRFGGWIPNYRVPETLCSYKASIHVPRRPYVDALRGIPTIRVFEALACGAPLVCSTWYDTEGLFTPGSDFLMADTPQDMTRHIRTVVCDGDAARELGRRGQETILSRHTCAHRVDELFQILKHIGTSGEADECRSLSLDPA